MRTPTSIPTAALGRRLRQLETERALATFEGLGGNALYRADLDGDIAVVRAAYVGAAVTDIATLRGELYGRPQG